MHASDALGRPCILQQVLAGLLLQSPTGRTREHEARHAARVGRRGQRVQGLLAHALPVRLRVLAAEAHNDEACSRVSSVNSTQRVTRE